MLIEPEDPAASPLDSGDPFCTSHVVSRTNTAIYRNSLS